VEEIMSLAFKDAGQLSEAAGQATYGMANLRPETTGLPFIVFISQKDDARHAAKVKWSPTPRVTPNQTGSYAIAPFGFKAGAKLASGEETLLRKWVETNCDVLQRYWDGDLAYTEEALALLQKI
jgi:hypothetical protein